MQMLRISPELSLKGEQPLIPVHTELIIVSYQLSVRQQKSTLWKLTVRSLASYSTPDTRSLGLLGWRSSRLASMFCWRRGVGVTAVLFPWLRVSACSLANSTPQVAQVRSVSPSMTSLGPGSLARLDFMLVEG